MTRIEQPVTAPNILAAAFTAMRRVHAVAGLDAVTLALAKFAEADVEAHTTESPRGSNQGKDLGKFFVADDYKPAGRDHGYAWCAAAVSYWVQKWLEVCPGARAYFPKLQAPCTARAFGLSEWARAQNGAVQIITPAMITSEVARPQPGDIAVFEFSHCGIVLAASKERRGLAMTCVEGNTDANGSREGWQVARRLRTPGNLRHLLRPVPCPLILPSQADRDEPTSPESFDPQFA